MSRKSQRDNEIRKDAGTAVLVVEPSRFMQRIYSTACASRGVATQSTGGVGAALSAVAKNKPMAVLTAGELPALPAVALIAALRSSPRHRAIPVGLVTCTDSAGECVGLYRPDAVIAKDDDLAGSVVDFLRSFDIGQESASDKSDGGRRQIKGKILLAEDTSMIQKLLGKILHVAGADVVMVENGAQAVAAASEQPFDLILMDIEMPEMDGREATSRIRAKGISVPIIASTTHDAESFRDEALKIGFDDVLVKPADRQVLIEICRKHLTKPG